MLFHASKNTYFGPSPRNQRLEENRVILDKINKKPWGRRREGWGVGGWRNPHEYDSLKSYGYSCFRVLFSLSIFMIKLKITIAEIRGSSVGIRSEREAEESGRCLQKWDGWSNF